MNIQIRFNQSSPKKLHLYLTPELNAERAQLWQIHKELREGGIIHEPNLEFEEIFIGVPLDKND